MPNIGDVTRAKDRWPEKIYSAKRSQRQVYQWVACPRCGYERWVLPWRLSDICKFCRYKAHKGTKQRRGEYSVHWKGGRQTRPGNYVDIYLQPDDFFFPMTRRNRPYVREHRLVMAKHLNRCLLPWEIVHHKNGIRDDNRFENLALLPSGYKHDVLTKMGNHIRTLEKRIQDLEHSLAIQGKNNA